MAEERIGIDIEVRLDQLKEQLRDTERMVGRTAATVDRTVTRTSQSIGTFAQRVGRGVGVGIGAIGAVAGAASLGNALGAVGRGRDEIAAFENIPLVGEGARGLRELQNFMISQRRTGGPATGGVLFGAATDTYEARIGAAMETQTREVVMQAKRSETLANLSENPVARLETAARFARQDVRAQFFKDRADIIEQFGAVTPEEENKLARRRDARLAAIDANRNAGILGALRGFQGTETLATAAGGITVAGTNAADAFSAPSTKELTAIREILETIAARGGFS